MLCAGRQTEAGVFREDVRERAFAGVPLLQPEGRAAARAAPPPDTPRVRLPPEPHLDGAVGQGLLAVSHVVPIDEDYAISQ